MARMTNGIRDAFVAAVMRCVPAVAPWEEEAWEARYRELLERDIAQEIKDFGKKFPCYLYRADYRSFKLGTVLDAHRDQRRTQHLAVYALAGSRLDDHPEVVTFVTRAKLAWGEYARLVDEKAALADRIGQVARTATTTEKLAKLLPELAHLIPTDALDKKLPMVVGASQLVADLVKAGAKLEESHEQPA